MTIDYQAFSKTIIQFLQISSNGEVESVTNGKYFSVILLPFNRSL